MINSKNQVLEKINVDIEFDFNGIIGQDNFTDYTIIIPGQNPFRVHRAILANYSLFFDNCLVSGLKEDTDGEFEVPKKTHYEIFPTLLQYMYTSEIDVTKENLLPLIEVSRYYQVQSLSEKLRTHINSILTPENALFFVNQCYLKELPLALEYVSNYISDHYSEISREGFGNSFDTKTFARILERAILNKSFEGNVEAEIDNFMNGETPSPEDAEILENLKNIVC